MRRLLPISLPGWSLPLIVLVLIVPSIAAFSLLGPQAGLAVGALTAASVITLAANARYEEEIEVAENADRRFRLLVLASEPISEPHEVEAIAAIAREGAQLPGLDGDPQVLVVAPARHSRLARWASDDRAARGHASRVVAVSLASLAAAGIDALGRIGDDDPIQALEDQLAGFAANEIAIQEALANERGRLDEIRRRIDRPVRRLGRAGG